ncbi:tetratricopeptide repeat protein [Aureibaculum sp. A20]|uniref:Tetratricopeptide repeat protein n=1 Tax=Aureibaculum flavum TaxID=2795986 RepID=A0ABS0WQ44_9FLAO|nr:tetratricopeptide repeat protein [Aureibaculum flavum]MBJ2174049.1 tetratricopeptide repeat protein [Aureibaculum flavum]
MNKLISPVILLLIPLVSCDFISHTHYFNEATVLEENGDFKEAILFLDKAIKRKPDFRPALLNRGVDKSMLEDYTGAIEDYKKILVFDSDNSIALLNIGNSYKRLGNIKKAIEYYDKALITEGAIKSGSSVIELRFHNEEDNDADYYVNDYKVYYERAHAYLLDNQYDMAILDFTKCIESNYLIGESQFFLGNIFFKKKDTINAYMHFKKSGELGVKDATDKLIELNDYKIKQPND